MLYVATNTFYIISTLAQRLLSGESVINNLYLVRGDVILASIFLILGIIMLKNLERATIKGGMLDML